MARLPSRAQGEQQQQQQQQGDCDGEVGAFVGVSGTVVFGGDGLVCVWTDWEGGGVFVDVWTDLVVGGAVRKGWGSVDVDTDWLVGDSPRSPLSGRLCRDVTPAARFLYPL